MFSCKRCGYSTNIKCDFKKHLLRKKQCKSELSNIEITILHSDFFVIKEKSKENKHVCEFCSKSFSLPSGKCVHKKKCQSKLLYEKKQLQIAEDLEEQKEQLEEQKEINKQLQEELKEAKKSGKTTNNKTTNNNTTNNNTNNNTNNINIQINMFGKENIEFLVNEPNYKNFMTRCLRNTDTGYIQLIDKIYFNQKHPENMNIKKSNKKDDYIKCYNGTAWKLMYSSHAIEIIMDQLNSAFLVFFEWIEDNEEERVKSSIVKTFMKEVGSTLNMDFSEYKYDFVYDNDDEKKIQKKRKILEKFCILNIYNHNECEVEGHLPFKNPLVAEV